MSDGTKSPKGNGKQIEVVEVDDKELDVKVELGATMFDVDDAKQKLNSTKKESRVVDGESILESLADSSQIIHVKGGKVLDSKAKSTKKTIKRDSTSVKSSTKKDKEDKESR